MINSTDNKKVIELCKLNITKYQNLFDNFIIEGEHLVREALKSGLLLEVFSLKETNISVPVTIVSESVMKKITNLDSIPNIIGICKKMDEKEVKGNVLILDGIQDPGNLGTIIRSAVAFNIDTIVLSDDTVNLYNKKVLRATQGMLFHINIIRRNIYDYIIKLKDDGYKIYTTNVNNGNDIKNVLKENKYAIIMGNEGNGVKKEIEDLADEYLYINMNKNCESLNVGVATSIILYELNR